MSIKEIFKRSFLKGFTAINIKSVSIAFAFCLLFDIYVYTVTYIYADIERNVRIRNIMVSLMATAVTLALQVNSSLSIGTIIVIGLFLPFSQKKEISADIFYLWAVVNGIMAGLGVAEIAIILAIIITLIIVHTSQK